MTSCQSCGAALRDGSSACTNCGATMVMETVAMAPSAPSASSSMRSRLLVTSTPDEGRFLPGSLVAGRYRVIGLLGRGGMGEVYRATDLTLAQSVALKFLPESAAASERLLERFHNEVRVARQVSHPNVCRVYDIGEAEGLPFISMEYVDGEDLASLLARIGRLPADKALDIARRLCAGIAAAHERGIIHRDLKPHNVMLNKRGEVVIMDFGLAAIADELRGAEARNGTPAYMSPEQLRGDNVTPRSDIYALGLIIYELFTGKRAFEGNSVAELLGQQETGRPMSITTIAADADPAVERVILRCLSPDPAQRPQTALSVAAALPGGDPLAAALAAGETPSPELVAASGRASGMRTRYAVACLAFFVVAFAVLAVVSARVSMLALAPVEHTVPVLENKAREMAASFGYTKKPADWFSEYQRNTEMVDHLQARKGQKQWDRWLAAESPYRFFYRESPKNLASPPDGVVSEDRPAMTEPGMLRLYLDTRGTLRGFLAVAPRQDVETPPPPADPAAVFRAAGLDIAAFQSASPAYAAPVAFDQRLAWTGTHPGLPDIPVRVEMATWRGQLVAFRMEWPWNRTVSDQPANRPFVARLVSLFGVTLLIAGLGFAFFIARRNLRQNRGDTRGATRLVILFGTLMLASWLMAFHPMPDPVLLGYAFQAFAMSLAVSVLMWLAYVALEPSVRARWPQSLVSWNRFLAGKAGDPLVGSHMLVGSAMGMALLCVLTWRTWWGVQSGELAADWPTLAVLAGTRVLVAHVIGISSGAFVTALAIFFLLCGLRAVLRRDWLAAAVASVLLAMQSSDLRDTDHLAVDLLLMVGVFAVFAFLLLRMGMVPAIAGVFVINTWGRIPWGGELNAWTTGPAIFLSVVILAVPVYGFWRSQSVSTDQPPR